MHGQEWEGRSERTAACCFPQWVGTAANCQYLFIFSGMLRNSSLHRFWKRDVKRRFPPEDKDSWATFQMTLS